MWLTVFPMPPAMVPPFTVPSALLLEPPTTLGLPPTPGSSRNARVLLTHNSSGWLSVVPRKSVPAIVLLFPVRLRSEEHTSELQSLRHLVCRLLLEKKQHT